MTLEFSHYSMLSSLAQPASHTKTAVLSLDCLDSIFKWLQTDCASLFSCCQVNKGWCERGLRVLYSKPFDFLHSFNAPNSPIEFHLEPNIIDISARIQLFLSTVVSDEFRGQYGKKVGYINSLRQLDFLIINSLLESSSALGGYNRDKIRYVFNVSRFSRHLEWLFCDEYAFRNQLLIPEAEIQYSRLHYLELYFGKNQHSILSSKNIFDIAQGCQNLQVLRIRARSSFTDDSLAYLIQRQQANSFRELLIERSQETSFEKTLSILYSRHKNSFTKIGILWCNQLRSLNGLESFPHLNSLEITNCHSFTNEGLPVPNGSFKFLRHLILRETAVTSSKVVSLCKHSGGALQTLNISVDTQLQLNLIRALVNYCTGLKNLAFSFLSFALEDLELLASGCVHLQKLKLGHPQENDLRLVERTLCKVIGAWKELEYLDIGHTPVTPLVISQLSTKKSLRQLKIDFAFQTNIFWTQVATVLGERFVWNVNRNDLNIIIYRL